MTKEASLLRSLLQTNLKRLVLLQFTHEKKAAPRGNMCGSSYELGASRNLKSMSFIKEELMKDG